MEDAKFWWQKQPAERTPHDWLFAAASELLSRVDDERVYGIAASIVMDFADDHAPGRPTRPTV